MRPSLMLLLMDRRVNLESRTRNAKRNTACTLASAQGGGTMYDILVAAGGDVNATTADGWGRTVSSGPTIQQFSSRKNNDRA